MSDAERPDAQPEPRGPQFQPDPASPNGPQQAGPPPNPPGQPGPQGQPYGGLDPAGPYGGPASDNAIPGQPYGPGPGGPGGPRGPGPYGPYRAGAATGPAANGARKSRLPLILVAAGVAFLLVVGITIAALRGGDDEPVATGSGGSSSEPAEAAKPSDAVRGFLEAVAASDGEKAASFLKTPPADTTFMTRPVLEASAKAAPLTGIDVPEVTDEYASRVTTRYNLGERAVVEEFSVSETGGLWQITRGASEFDLSYQRDETLPLLINGVELEQDVVSLLPGTYAFTTSSTWVSYGDKATLTLTGPSDYTSPRLTPTLTKDAKAAFVKTTKAALDKCLDQHELAPSGCPNRLQLRDGQKVDEKTVRWSLTNDPFKNARVTLDHQDPSVVEGTFYPRYNFKAEGSVDGRRATFDGPPIGLYSFTSSGDLSTDTIKVELALR
ncbi:hypothetical protein SAMN04488543_1763 [Friedmanniella luteola]|uniref:Uncharacterized protein n=1 Tax=Friedmanniella luteola TaxID=546871 RepID=A0A1H1SC50_9ACTN|nr:hypothetical protein [Friedmanniella luteola]SDS45554.1 hypothetical protein SAMN04488543_1763 [Friedmanniella luteola]